VSDVIVMVGISVVAFVSTNLDNLFLLMGLLASSPHRKVMLGYTLAVAAVLGVGLAGSYLADFSAQAWLRWLGLVPLSMGAWRLRGLFRSPAAATEASPGAGPRGAASVFGVTLANSGDSLGVFTSLMSETSELLVFVILLTVLGMSALWIRAARWVAEHPALAPWLHQIDRYGVPLLLVALGLYILSDTATDTL
jgi:cadmium resistance protein CadD (predicted permease)